MTIMDRGPVVIRRRLGSVLKQLRTAKGYQLDFVARGLEMSPAKLSRLETGQVAPKIRDVRDLLEQYEAPPDVRRQLLGWADDAKGQGWWQPFSATVPGDLNLYISLEAEASLLKIFAFCIPPLVETKPYASMVLRGMAPQPTEAQHEELLQIRMRRQAVVDPDREGAPPLKLHVVLDEGALHRGPATGPVMVDQLRDLLRRSRTDNVEVQVFPFSAGYSEALSMFSIFEPREKGDVPVVCVESTARDAYYDGAADLARYEAIWTDLSTRAATLDESYEIIERAAQRWEHNLQD